MQLVRYEWTHICINVHTYYTHTNVHTHIYIYMHGCICTYICKHTYTIYTHAYTFTYPHSYIHTCMHIYTHYALHTYTHTWPHRCCVLSRMVLQSTAHSALATWYHRRKSMVFSAAAAGGCLVWVWSIDSRTDRPCRCEQRCPRMCVLSQNLLVFTCSSGIAGLDKCICSNIRDYCSIPNPRLVGRCKSTPKN